MKRKLEVDNQEIIKLYNEGKSTFDIEKLFKISRGAIKYRLNCNGVICRPRAKIEFNDIKSKEGTPEFDYFLGILATDGYIYKGVVTLEFAENNKDILTYWNEFLGNKCNINKHIDKQDNKTYYKISFMNRTICDYLFTFGITERKSLTLEMKYINWNVLLGIFDGDGSLTLDKRRGLSQRFSIASGSRKFLEQIKEFLSNNNIKSSIYVNKGWYSLSISNFRSVHIIYNNIYKDSSYFLKRKYDKFCPLIEKFIRKHSVNSVKERENY